jgi:hypothetical protein
MLTEWNRSMLLEVETILFQDEIFMVDELD